MTNTELHFYDLVPMNLKSITDELKDISKNLERLNKNLEAFLSPTGEPQKK